MWLVYGVVVLIGSMRRRNGGRRTMFLLRRRCESERVSRVWCVVYMEKGLDQSRDMQIHQSERRKKKKKRGHVLRCTAALGKKRGKGMERERERA